MPVLDLGVLDTIISVVVVILLLSMVVQSLQTFVKKLSNFKSRQIEKSLQQLFDHVAESAPATGAANASKVLAHFQSLGRHNTFGKQAVESISKADLSKIVTSIEGAGVVPQKVKDAAAEFFKALEDVLWAVTAGLLCGYWMGRDRKSTRLNSSHSQISYAVFCLKKK